MAGPHWNPRRRSLRRPERQAAGLLNIYGVTRSQEWGRRWVVGGGEDEKGGQRRGEAVVVARSPGHDGSKRFEGQGARVEM